MTAVVFHVWGSRGGRSTRGSKVGNSTSCYSVSNGPDLFVFDAGSGLVALSEAVAPGGLLAQTRRVHILLTHAHMDHWEGLKNADWMWRKDNGIELTVLAPNEALETIRRGHEPPAFVPLEVLAINTVASLTFVELTAGAVIKLPGAAIEPVALHHYSGIAPHERPLDSLGYRLSLDGGPTIAYLCDHEPTEATRAMEDAVLAVSHLAITDASFACAREHAFGHGSIEHSAQLARRHPRVRVLAAHHGPGMSDNDIADAHQQHGGGCENLAIAVEQHSETWDSARACFVSSTR